MKCPVCNVDAAEGAHFCPQCGGNLPGSGGEGAQPAGELDAGRSAGRANDGPEETLWEGSYSPKAMLGYAIAAGVVSFALLLAALMFVEGGAFRWLLLGAIFVIW